MKQHVYITEDSLYFNKDQIVEGIKTNNGIRVGKHFVPESQYVVLNEKLTKKDEDKVRKIVREMLKKMFWRMYTRSAFITK